MKLEDGMEVERFCKKCEFSAKLIVRTNKKSGKFFLGCPSWPECDFTELLPNSILAALAGHPELPLV